MISRRCVFRDRVARNRTGNVDGDRLREQIDINGVAARYGFIVTDDEEVRAPILSRRDPESR